MSTVKKLLRYLALVLLIIFLISLIGDIFFVRGEFSEYLPDWHPYEKYNSFYSDDYFFYEHSWIDSIDIDEIDDLKLARLAFKMKNEKI